MFFFDKKERNFFPLMHLLFWKFNIVTNDEHLLCRKSGHGWMGPGKNCTIIEIMDWPGHFWNFQVAQEPKKPSQIFRGVISPKLLVVPTSYWIWKLAILSWFYNCPMQKYWWCLGTLGTLVSYAPAYILKKIFCFV